MVAIYIEYYKVGLQSVGSVINLPEGSNAEAELEKAKLSNPEKHCEIIASQSFGFSKAGGPEHDMASGY